jgi:hypothetical protein
MPHLRVPSLVVAATILVFAAPAAAQKAAANAAPRCAALLTADEVKAAIGVAMQDLGADVRGEGETECDWMLRGAPGGLKTVAVSFYDERAIKASPTAPTGDGFFEMLVKAAEESTSTKREVIAGVGQHAAFVPTAPQTLAVVHRADGVARIVANGLTKAQTIAIAKAVATP